MTAVGQGGWISQIRVSGLGWEYRHSEGVGLGAGIDEMITIGDVN